MKPIPDNHGSVWLDHVYEGCGSIEGTACILRGLGHSFYRTGNQQVAQELFDEADNLDAATKHVRDATNAELDCMVRGAQQMSATILGACLQRVSRQPALS